MAASVLLAAAAGASARSHGLTTAVMDGEFAGSSAGLALDRTRAAGARAVRLTLHWNAVAPAATERQRPAFDAASPAAPEYNWTAFDRQVQLAAQRGLEPIVNVVGAPGWAQGPMSGSAAPSTEAELRRHGSVRPSPEELAAFATAAARRYGGGFQGLPRVRYWQLWNEPNLIFFLAPQLVGGRSVSPVWYRSMVNAFAGAVHAVRRDNLVVAGGTAPFTSRTGRQQLYGLGPLRFMRELLCLSRSLRPTCSARVAFDVWAHHPYTSGGPTHRANFRDDVSLGDLPRMKAVLDAAVRHRKIVSGRRVGFWVTEFSWDTSPPDPQGVPARLHARWTAEALYRMWRNGVSLVTWFTLRDDPFRKGSFFQSGLYFRGATMARDRPKPALQAFRFPFVALREGKGVTVWGRTPSSRPGLVAIERTFRGGWTRVRVLRASRSGIFTARLAGSRTGSFRARAAGSASVPFSAAPVPDRFIRPFGTGWD